MKLYKKYLELNAAKVQADCTGRKREDQIKNSIYHMNWERFLQERHQDRKALSITLAAVTRNAGVLATRPNLVVWAAALDRNIQPSLESYTVIYSNKWIIYILKYLNKACTYSSST